MVRIDDRAPLTAAIIGGAIEAHKALLTCLKPLGTKRGLLLNFHSACLKDAIVRLVL